MKTLGFLAVIVGCGLLASSGGAASHGDRCDGCGCSCECDKVCKLVCETKKIKKVHYACECEDICIPGRSCPGCKECAEADVPAGEKKDCCDACAHRPRGDISWKNWSAITCGEVKNRKKLTKYEVTADVPSYKWVVEKLCPNCCGAPAPKAAE